MEFQGSRSALSEPRQITRAVVLGIEPKLLIRLLHTSICSFSEHDTKLRAAITPARMIRIENSLENKPFASGFGDESVSLSSRGNTRGYDSHESRRTHPAIRLRGIPVFLQPNVEPVRRSDSRTRRNLLRRTGWRGKLLWEMFDQVLLRPSLMDGLEDLRILDHDGVESLLTKNGLPDSENGSDHLLILFRLSMK